MDTTFNCVLLIDDDSINNYINHQLLRKVNLSNKIHIATTGEEAIRLITEYSRQNERQCPELIILDINMPGMDGFEFLEEFNKLDFVNRNKLELIFLTTSTAPRDIERIEKNFKLSYLNKPLTKEKLMSALKKNRGL